MNRETIEKNIKKTLDAININSTTPIEEFAAINLFIKAFQKRIKEEELREACNSQFENEDLKAVLELTISSYTPPKRYEYSKNVNLLETDLKALKKKEVITGEAVLLENSGDYYNFKLTGY